MRGSNKGADCFLHVELLDVAFSDFISSVELQVPSTPVKTPIDMDSSPWNRPSVRGVAQRIARRARSEPARSG